MKRRGVRGLETRAYRGIVRKRGEVELVEQRPDIQTRPTDDECDLAARANLGKRGSAISLIAEDVVALARVCHIDEVMPNSRAFLRRRLRRADVHRAIDLARVGRHDLAAQTLRDAHRERAFARRGRADDRDHVRTAASTARRASRARTTVSRSGPSSP